MCAIPPSYQIEEKQMIQEHEQSKRFRPGRFLIMKVARATNIRENKDAIITRFYFFIGFHLFDMGKNCIVPIISQNAAKEKWNSNVDVLIKHWVDTLPSIKEGTEYIQTTIASF